MADQIIHVVKPGESYSVIAKKYGISTNDLVAQNGAKNPNNVRFGAKLVIPARGGAPVDDVTFTAPKSSKYVVQSGENLSTIAKKYGVSTNELALANNITNPNMVRVGMSLTIPVKGKAEKKEQQPKATISAARKTNPFVDPSKKHIMIDIGHGAIGKSGYRDVGAPACDGSDEYTYNRKCAKELKRQLEEAGYEVAYTSGGSVNQRHSERDKTNPDFFISLHNNGSVNKNASGESVLYGTAANKKYAEAINAELKKEQSIPKNEGIALRSELAVVNKAKMPAVLIEFGYVSNADDVAALGDTSKLSSIMDAVVKGVKKTVPPK